MMRWAHSTVRMPKTSIANNISGYLESHGASANLRLIESGQSRNNRIQRLQWRAAMNQLEDLRVFVQVAQNVTFSAAACALNLSQSSVSRKIASLETHLGLQLVKRTSTQRRHRPAQDHARRVGVRLRGNCLLSERFSNVQPSTASPGLGRLFDWLRSRHLSIMHH